MGKYARRLMADDIFHIGRTESWFSSMARKGLHLKKLGLFFITFEKGEPRNTKYRIDILGGKPSEEQLSVYRACGWDHVANHRMLHVFAADPDTPELHTDPTEQALTLTALNSRFRVDCIVAAVLIAFLAAVNLIRYFSASEHTLSFIEGHGSNLYSMIALIFFTIMAFQRFFSIQKLRKELFSGKDIAHHPKSNKPRYVILASYLLIFLIFIFALITANVKIGDPKTLPEENVNLPTVRLSEIENDPNLVREESFVSVTPIKNIFEGVDFNNRVTRRQSFWGPEQYEIFESGRIEGETRNGNSGSYSPSLHTRYFRLRCRGMAPALIKDLIKQQILPHDPYDIKEIDSPFFEKTYFIPYHTRQMMFAYKNNRAVFVSYSGDRSLEDMLPLLSERIGGKDFWE